MWSVGIQMFFFKFLKIICCLDKGTQLPYIEFALKEGFGVIVLNTNQVIFQKLPPPLAPGKLNYLPLKNKLFFPIQQKKMLAYRLFFLSILHKA